MILLNPEDFFFNLPLYTPIKVTNANYANAIKLFQSNYTTDAYNPSIKQETTYKITRTSGLSSSDSLDYYKGFTSFKLNCVRNDYTIRVYVLLESDGNNEFILKKVGQYPSIADLHISKIREYDKVLDRTRIKEITKAVGLAANGVGIGSFVYLRRVFEFLIEDAHKMAKNDNDWNEEEYQKSRIIEKIELLKLHLPEFLVANKTMYGILSKGIHSLEEDECLAYFDALKVGIELILDEKVDQQNKMKKIQEAQTRLSSIAQNIANK